MMASTSVTTRGLVFDAISAAKTADKFVYNDFTVGQTNDPKLKLTQIPAKGQVWVVGAGADDERVTRESDVMLVNREQAVMVSFQRLLQNVPPAELDDLIDQLTELVEQLVHVASRAAIDNSQYTFQRCAYLKDISGTPFQFTRLREANTFEAYFNVTFKCVI